MLYQMKCHRCAQLINVEAQVCPYCHVDIDSEYSEIPIKYSALAFGFGLACCFANDAVVSSFGRFVVALSGLALLGGVFNWLSGLGK